jgi:hypothetical protein
MTRIILVDPKLELILHSIAIETRTDGARLDYYWHREERTRGYEILRVLVSGGSARVMDREDPIPVPVQFAGQCLDARPAICKRVRSGS